MTEPRMSPVATEEQRVADTTALAPYAGEAADGDTVALLGPGPLWLVTGGEMDLYGVAGLGRGRWRFLARLGPGSVLPSCSSGPDHVLVGRPAPGASLHRLDLVRLRAELARHHDEHSAPDALPPQHEALARGVGSGLQGMLDCLSTTFLSEGDAEDDRTPLTPGSVKLPAGREGVSESGLLWVGIGGGTINTALGQSGAGEVIPLAGGDVLRATSETVLGLCRTGDLLLDGSLWPQLAECEQRVRYLLDRQRRHDEERLLAGRTAAAQALSGAVRTLHSQLKPTSGAETAEQPATVPDGRPGPDAEPPADDATFAAVTVVAKAMGITLTPPPSDADNRLDPIERIALTSHFRLRRVGLKAQWWRSDSGPLLGRIGETGAPVALLRHRGGYRVVDPATARARRVTEEVAAEIEPTAVMFYRPLTAETSGLVGLLKFGLRGSTPDLLRVAAAGGVAVTLGLVVPVVTGKVLGTFIPNGERGQIAQACLAVVLAALVSMAFTVVKNLSMLRAEGRFEASLQAGVWDRLLRAPAGFFSRYSTGELAGTALGISRIRMSVSGITTTITQTILLAISNFVLQLTYSASLTLLSLGLVLVNAAVFGALVMRQLRWQRELMQLDDKLTDKVFQTLQGLPKLRVAAAENFAYGEWAKHFARSQELTRRVLRLQHAVTVFTSAYVPLSTLALYGTLAASGPGSLSVSEFLSFSVAFSIQLSATAQLVGAVASLGSIVPLFERLKPILEEPSEVPEGAEAPRPPGTLTGKIEVRDVFFSYGKNGPPVLQNVSLEIEPGEFVAIVGPSGSGKSSLLRLLIGFERPTTGSIRYDDQDMAGLDTVATRRQCGVVMQHARPLRGSILDNIRGAEQHSMAAVRAAVEMSGLADDIEAMPMGLHTVLSDGGSSLSGGQRQRLMIAQALVRRPKILFFDEATSALDNETQRIVTESTRTLRATRLVVAHRLSTVLDADRIVVLEQGRIVQNGSPAELLADEDGLFHRLARRQQG
ncbi:NHLP bacteriocin export ABC transporter permease/ATPase subunit [Streptomyces lunalinharesii]|uniref:NHLP bacteriocin export ABC transporter permease/ATPase subunit n=1 Tax=Streptomyces lunalinharesii TaxID=333384 RepID=A0ABN3SL00_9ACTN